MTESERIAELEGQLKLAVNLLFNVPVILIKPSSCPDIADQMEVRRYLRLLINHKAKSDELLEMCYGKAEGE